MTTNSGGGPLTSAAEVGAGYVGDQGRQDLYLRVVKPVFDRLVGAVLLLLVLPIVLISAVCILVSLGRPVFYSQERIGLGGKPFQLYKLRTMIPDRRVNQNGYQGEERRRNHKAPDDPRVKGVGKILRAARLDELPQFWNVVKGDMSLVGPRPEMPIIVSKYEPWQHQRHLVKPGVTGPWQISERNGKAMHECTDLDLEYIDRASFLHDLSIIVKTPLAMFGRHGY